MKMILEIDGKYLKSSYSIYLIELIAPDGNYYYIGQTGDKVYNSARSPFRRISGHLVDINSSTQNQLYRFVSKLALKKEINRSVSLTPNEKGLIEDYITNSMIKFYSYPLLDFDFNQSMTIHKQKLKKIVLAENSVIQLFEKMEMNLININRPTRQFIGNDFDELLTEIKKDLNLKHI